MKNVMIIGSNRGIGLALVKKYSDNGFKVIALCREASKELKEISNITIYENAEVTDIKSLKKISEKIDEIDIYLHVSGIWANDNFFNSPNWDELFCAFEVNSIAPLKAFHVFHKHLKKGSKIGFMSSRMGSIEDNTSGGRYAYRMSKAALNCAVKSLSIDLKNKEISVAALHPGFVQTDMTNGNGNLSPKQSAEGLFEVMNNLSIKNTGSFFHSNSENLPW